MGDPIAALSNTLDVGAEADAVPAARRFARATTARVGLADLADTAELVASELVTNALLHGREPVRLTVVGHDSGVRIEVQDGSRDIPVRPRAGAEGMTGRGLALVDAVSQLWGVDPVDSGGKVVWAEITVDSAAAEEPTFGSLDDLLASFDDVEDEPGPQLYTVAFGDAPTQLLLASKAHVDSVIRELTLSAAGAASGMSAALPPYLVELINTVVTDFSAARQALKRLAASAAEHHQSRTQLTLTLPASAADAAERYLEALEKADAFARASRLLTFAAPPQQYALRRWYVAGLAKGLRAAEAGIVSAPATTFEAFLLDQVEELATLQEVSTRAARLQRVTAALAAVLSADSAAAVALDDAMAELGAARGCALLSRDGVLTSAADRGYSGDHYALMLAAWQAGGDVPAVRAIETGQPIWLESRLECEVQFPRLHDIEPDIDSLVVMPMTVADRVVGVLRVAFAGSRLFAYDERAFLAALAAVTAQAIDRASSYTAQATVADQLTRLGQVTSALSQVRSLDQVLDVTITHATGIIGAQVASVSLLEEDGTTVRVMRLEPPLANSRDWSTFALSDDLPVTMAIRTGEYLHIATVAERNVRWPMIASVDAGFERSLVVLPLIADKVTFGALTLSFAAEVGGEPARGFLTAFTDACAQAIERARADERADGAARKLAFLARAAAELAASFDVDSTLSSVARLAVPELADCCVVHLLKQGALEAVAIEHFDADKGALVREFDRRWPEQLAEPTSVASVVRTGITLRLHDVSTFRRDGATAGSADGRAQLLDQFGFLSALIVPLRGRSRVLGAMTFLTAESGRRYAAADQSLIEDLARRASIAIENAQLFNESTRNAASVLRAAESSSGDADPVLAAAAIGRFELNLPAGSIEADEIVTGLFGLQQEDATTILGTYLDRVHPQDLASVGSAIAAAVERSGSYSMQFRVVWPDGRLRWLAARGRAITAGRDPGTVAGVMYEATADGDRRGDLARLLETMNDAFYRLDREWRFTYVNSQAERMLFRPRSELLGHVVWEAYPDIVGSIIEVEFRRAQQSGAQTSFEIYYPPVLSWFEARATPDSEGMSVFFHDITARKKAEEARVQAHDRLALLGEAARGLVGTIDVSTVMHQVASVVVPRLADWVVVTMLDAAGRPTAQYGLHYDAVVAAEVGRAAQLAGGLLTESNQLEEVLRTGTPLVLSAVDIRSASAIFRGNEWPNLLEMLGFASVAVVPLQSRSATVGLLTMVNGPARTPFDEQDVATAVDIGRRAGLALENAQLHARQRNASEVLQRSLLTPLPDDEHLLIGARYLPAGEVAQIGGDWYDAFRQPDGSTVFAIGDVVGHDMNAAAAMGQLRNLLRGVAFDREETPAMVLSRVDAAIKGLRIDTLATAVVGTLAQGGAARDHSARLFRWSNAGHPPPMLMRADGSVVVLEGRPDLLLGLDPETPRTDHTALLHPGDTLLLYTDGLVERRDSPIQEGLARLQAAFGDLVAADLEELCDGLVQRLLPADADDDVALVAVRLLQGAVRGFPR